jgi:uncharacterized protein YutE (UPF0331/DUF86 family)
MLEKPPVKKPVQFMAFDFLKVNTKAYHNQKKLVKSLLINSLENLFRSVNRLREKVFHDTGKIDGVIF